MVLVANWRFYCVDWCLCTLLRWGRVGIGTTSVKLHAYSDKWRLWKHMMIFFSNESDITTSCRRNALVEKKILEHCIKQQQFLIFDSN